MNKEEIKEKLSIFKEKVKGFNITKYLLERKEGELKDSIELKKGLIEHWTLQIEIDKAHITATECEIAILNKDIKKLETDVKKIVKVLNLYIV